MDATRISLSNRPLPAYPPESHPRTPSVSSMSARLIDQTSPNPFQRGQSFSTSDHHFHLQQSHPPSHLHHPDLLPLDLDPTHHQLRNQSVTSPQIPQLSQPLSDLSSATPSSVFTESNVPHPEENASSPNTPKAYEVPSDSKTCHQSVSPVMSHHTLPNPRRPHTATGVMASQPVLSRHPQSSHSPVSFAHSSTDVRTNQQLVSNRPPEVPPHRGNSQQKMLTQPPSHNPTTSPVYARPESGLYSEIPNEHGDVFPKISPPTESITGHSLAPHSIISDNSLVGSDQYNDYSDVTGPCVSPLNDIGQSKLPSVLEYRDENRLSSESMSSFSTDSQSSSPSHSRIGDITAHHHLTRINSSRSGQHNVTTTTTIPEEHDYDEANSIITDSSISGKFSNSKTSHIDVKVSFTPRN